MIDARHNQPCDAHIGPKPIEHGGTFKEIVDRAWSDDYCGQLLSDSFEMIVAADLLESGSNLARMGSAYMTVKDMCFLQIRPLGTPLA